MAARGIYQERLLLFRPVLRQHAAEPFGANIIKYERFRKAGNPAASQCSFMYHRAAVGAQGTRDTDIDRTCRSSEPPKIAILPRLMNDAPVSGEILWLP